MSDLHGIPDIALKLKQISELESHMGSTDFEQFAASTSNPQFYIQWSKSVAIIPPDRIDRETAALSTPFIQKTLLGPLMES